ncbi:MAG: amidohydrolase, partial [Devosia sp.]|uniref:amidohydrolase family protein n=1 Tax=Devosia sp. TaxID=1871048 RepID=UPI002613A7AE
LDRIRAAQEGGLPIRGQFFARTIGILFGLDLSYHPFSLNPSYRPLADLPLAEKVMALRDRELRARLLVEEPEDSNPFVVSMVKRTQMLFPLGDPPNYRPAPEENLAMRAAVMGVSTRDLIYDELLKQDGRAILYCPLGDMSQDARMMFDQPGVTLALGDGGAHYGMLCDASYPTYLLTRLVRDAPAEEALPLPQAIKALTRDPAETVGFLDRGLIRTGLKADLNVIDYDRLRLHQPTVARDLPSDGKRLSQKADGYMLTIVSGEITYREGVATGALPGRLIRGATRPAEMIA